jgi:phosphoribosylformimino-5-aminoimidazole carboxamide ribotide isomerase
MIVVPAVDVRHGRVVRLRQGRAEDETVYGADPAEAARQWEAEGAKRLHLVDLDAAIDAKPQTEVVARVIAAVSIPVEVGGGLRSLEIAARYRQAGAERLIFGTAAVAAPEMVEEAARRWPGAVAVAVDARDGKVTVKGWYQDTATPALELVTRMRACGVLRVQYTDVVRDGTLQGPNLRAIEEVARLGGVKVTAAGGIAVLDDLVRLAVLEPLGVDEVVVGKALYEGVFNLEEATLAVAGSQVR